MYPLTFFIWFKVPLFCADILSSISNNIFVMKCRQPLILCRNINILQVNNRGNFPNYLFFMLAMFYNYISLYGIVRFLIMLVLRSLIQVKSKTEDLIVL